jgi:hypothetical protein
MDEVGKLLEHLGYATPFIYAAAAYGLFAWLDNEASDEAKAALVNTMKPRNVSSALVASALVEVFDNLYTRPLLSRSAFLRSMMFTLLVTFIFLFEVGANFVMYTLLGRIMRLFYYTLAVAIFVNVFTDYISLFVIRRWLLSYGSKPVKALLSCLLIGVLIVSGGNLARTGMLLLVGGIPIQIVDAGPFRTFLVNFALAASYAVPAVVVFAWLPLFALGIVIIRLMNPLSWVVGKTQWLLKDGNEHPLKAIGYVAAIAVFIVTAGWQTIFRV